MNLERIYNQLIAAAVKENGRPSKIGDKKRGYVIHHIKPCSLFLKGRKDKEAHEVKNLVFVTHRQHFTAHHILMRIYGGKLAFAFQKMKEQKPLKFLQPPKMEKKTKKESLRVMGIKIINIKKDPRRWYVSDRDFLRLLSIEETAYYKSLIADYIGNSKAKRKALDGRRSAQRKIMRAKGLSY
ncbi:hypothetical protein JXH92_003687 [Salmonella enterica subsp. enterica serovar 4,[5],12:b:-]|nr:hypothetical protein [Salmonella enterica subsp. enterica serovar 4,[5],12:b:-]